MQQPYESTNTIRNSAQPSSIESSRWDSAHIFEFPCNIVQVSGTRSGKSRFWADWFQTNMNIFEIIYIVSGTAKMTKAFSEFKGKHPHFEIFDYVMSTDKDDTPTKTFIHNVFPEILKAMAEEIEKNGAANTCHVCILLDDIVGDLENRKNMRDLDRLSHFFTKSRHYNISIIMLSQISNGVYSKKMRNNTGYFLMGQRVNPEQLEIISTAFNIPTDKLIEFLSNLEPFQFMVIDEKHGSDEYKVIKSDSAYVQPDYSLLAANASKRQDFSLGFNGASQSYTKRSDLSIFGGF